MKSITKKLKIAGLAVALLAGPAAIGAPMAALALGIPYAVQGQVTLDGAAADGASVVLTDVNTGATLSDTVGLAGASGTSGWYSFDLGNLSIAATAGDTINVVATINTLSGTASFVYNPVTNPSFVIPATIAIVTPPPTSFTITPSSGAGGMIMPMTPTTVLSGASQTFTITPDAGFNILDVLVDGVSVGAVASYTFTGVTANHTIAASFTSAPLPTFTITPSSGAGGMIMPMTPTTVSSGASQTFTITADIGFSIQDVLVDGVSVGAVASYTFTNVVANHTISASFAAVPLASFMITSSAGANGAIAPLGINMYTTGTNAAYTMTPNPGFEVADVLVDGVSVGAVASYTFTNVVADHTISASFRAVPALTSLSIAPASASAAVGGTAQFSATMLDQYGAPFAAVATWSSNNTAVATVSQSGLASALAVGSATISVSAGGLIASAPLTVTPPPILTTITVSPAAASVMAGNTQQFTATAFDQFGSPFAATITWASDNTAVATVNASGLASALTAGSATISASSGGISGSAILTVTPVPVLTTINVSPAAASAAVGTTKQFSAAFLDQFAAPIAAATTWSSSDLLVATIGTNGLASALAIGTTTITATTGLVSGSAVLTVTPVPVLTTINVTPATSSLVAGGSLQFSAAALDQFGTPIAAALTWSSSNQSVALVDPSGFATSLAAGTSTIIAASGLVSGSAALTVTPVPVLTTIVITPVNPSVNVGSTQQFSAAALDQFGALLNPAPVILWSSDATTTATIDTNGLSSALAVGTSLISASNGAVTGTTTLTVTAIPVTPPPSGGGGGGGGGGAPAPTPAPGPINPPVVPPAPTAEEEHETRSPQVLGEKIYADGTLLKLSDGKVYLIIKGAKKYIGTKEELSHYTGIPFVNTDPAPLVRYADYKATLGLKIYGDGNLARDKQSKKIYLIGNGLKTPINSLAQLAKYKGRKIFEANPAVLSEYATVAVIKPLPKPYGNNVLLKEKGANRIYVIKNGAKILVTKPSEIAKYRGYKMYQVTETALEHYPLQ